MTQEEAIRKATDAIDWRNRMAPKRVFATFHDKKTMSLDKGRSGWLVSFEFDVPWDPNTLFVKVYDPGNEVVVLPML